MILHIFSTELCINSIIFQSRVSHMRATLLYYYHNMKHLHAYMSRVVRKAAFCICENKDADQLRGNCEADQRFCFRYTDSTIPLLPKSEISNLLPSCVAVQDGFCRTWSETPKTGFLRTGLILFYSLTIFIPPVYEVYRGYIVFAFSVCLCVCEKFFSSNISQQLLDLGF